MTAPLPHPHNLMREVLEMLQVASCEGLRVCAEAWRVVGRLCRGRGKVSERLGMGAGETLGRDCREVGRRCGEVLERLWGYWERGQMLSWQPMSLLGVGEGRV